VSYVGLGPRMKVGAADTTGNNKGNWTVEFTPADIAISTQIPSFEVYKMTVQGASGSSLTVFVDLYQWDSTLLASLNSWDPAQPLILQQGQTIYFYYSDLASDGDPPTVTIWLRYDPAIQSGIFGTSAGST
jgi:hypothetical protein